MSKPVSITRSYEATPERLFAAWIDVETLERWWGCGVDQLWNVHVWEPTPGGAVHVSMKFDSGSYEVRGTVAEVEEPHRLVIDWEQGQQIVVLIEASADGSTMTIEHHGLPDDAMREIVTGGWSVSVENIRKVL